MIKGLTFTLKHILCPLILGTIIYVFFRSSSLIYFKLISNSQLDSAREVVQVYIESIPSWVLYSLPDGLWVYSFSATLFLIWGKNFKGIKVITLIPFMFLCFIEFLQHLKIVMGTFDVMDVFVALLTYFILIINLKLFKDETQN